MTKLCKGGQGTMSMGHGGMYDQGMMRQQRRSYDLELMSDRGCGQQQGSHWIIQHPVQDRGQEGRTDRNWFQNSDIPHFFPVVHFMTYITGKLLTDGWVEHLNLDVPLVSTLPHSPQEISALISDNPLFPSCLIHPYCTSLFQDFTGDRWDCTRTQNSFSAPSHRFYEFPKLFSGTFSWLILCCSVAPCALNALCISSLIY